MTKATTESSSIPSTTGRLIHWAARYDILAWVYLLGRERAFRERLVDLARIQRGEAVLDVGCGTGTQAIVAKRRVGPAGSVAGIDPSPEMIARAVKKARTASVDVDFRTAIAEQLPFADAEFDAVTSTLMLHHLPRQAREQCAREMRRVLKPGGRVLAVDFGFASSKRGILGHFHRHGHVELNALVELITNAGLVVVASGALRVRDLQYVLATKPSG